jgi:hypothetical protein
MLNGGSGFGIVEGVERRHRLPTNPLMCVTQRGESDTPDAREARAR